MRFPRRCQGCSLQRSLHQFNPVWFLAAKQKWALQSLNQAVVAGYRMTFSGIAINLQATTGLKGNTLQRAGSLKQAASCKTWGIVLFPRLIQLNHGCMSPSTGRACNFIDTSCRRARLSISRPCNSHTRSVLDTVGVTVIPKFEFSLSSSRNSLQEANRAATSSLHYPALCTRYPLH